MGQPINRTYSKRIRVAGKTPFFKSILFRFAILTWLLIIVALGVFVISIIPYQKKIAVEHMKSEAKGIASSIGQVTANAIILEDYSFAVDHCMKVIKESNSIRYVVISKHDGFSLIHTRDRWRMENLSGHWVSKSKSDSDSQIKYSSLVDERVFHYCYPFNYSGIDWGWIHIGLSLDDYRASTAEMYKRTILLAFFCSVIGLAASVLFARRLTRPILQLDKVTQQIAEGEMTARAAIESKDELESLAISFNKMTDALIAAHQKLEARVKERTAELEKANRALQDEIKERRRTEKELQKSETQYRNLFNQIPNPIFVFDKKTKKFLHCNQAVLNQYGYSLKEIQNMTPFDLHPKEDLPSVEKHIDVKNFDTPFSYTHIAKSGKKMMVDIRSDEIQFRGTPAWLSVVQDVTDRKKAEEQQERLMKELEHANKELKDFAYIVSHDLKAPLRAIGSLAEWLIADHREQLGDEGKEQLDLLISRVRRMHDLVEGILQYSRVGRLTEDKEQVDLNTLVNQVIDSISPPEHIKVVMKNNLPSIVCEKTRIGQVFQNLISNAIKYMDKPNGEIDIGCVQENGYWEFSVTDNGPGIDEKYYEKIFQIFQTLAPRDEYESTGIGLTLVKKIIETNGGQVWVESKVGEGSTFRFKLPR